MAVLEADIARDFTEAKSNPDLVAKCVRICNEYGLSAQELADEWDILMMKHGTKRAVSLEALGELEGVTRQSRDAKRAKLDNARPSQFNARSNAPTFTKDTAHLLGSILSSTPSAARRPAAGLSTPQTSGPSPSGTFTTRADAGKVVCSLNPTLGVAKPKESEDAMMMPTQLKIAVTGGATAEMLGESMMWERLEERARLLDAQLGALETLIDGQENFPPLASVTSTGVDEVVVVGRVCCEGEGKLNLQSIFLEGSRASSNGCRVRLDLSGCKEFALFPGQIVAAIGVNAVGHTFVPRKIVHALPPASDAAPAEKAQVQPVTLMSAAGPLSTTDDLSYAPLTALLAKAVEVRPDALVLIGPFVDEQHPALSNAEVPCSYQELFERQVLAKLSEFIEDQIQDDGKITHVVLLPSTRDVHHQPVYPQPPFAESNVVPEHCAPYLHYANNPAHVSIGGVRIGACSVDTLFLLGQQELARTPPVAEGAPKPDRMARLASHVLGQRQLLPLFPAPTDERAPLAVDVCANLKAGALPSLPDILLAPSELAPFAKLCHAGVLAVNPGRLTRKAAGGNYATICIHPPKPPVEEPAADETPADAEAEPAAKPEEPDMIMEAALGLNSGVATAAEGTPAATAESAPVVKPEEGGDKGAPSGVLPLPADAPDGLVDRAFVEVKRI